MLFTGGNAGGAVVNNLPANAGDTGDRGSISGSGKFPGGGNGNPLQYSCLENSMDRSLEGCSLCCRESDTTERLRIALIETGEHSVVYYWGESWDSKSLL